MRRMRPRYRGFVLTGILVACLVALGAVPAVAGVRLAGISLVAANASARPASRGHSGAAVGANAPGVSTSSVKAPSAFDVLWTVTDPNGKTVPLRVGRHRKTASAWGDDWENFGYVHLAQGHLGVGKDWLVPKVMTYWVQKTLSKPGGIYPDLNDKHNDKYILCDEYQVFGHGLRITTTVVVDMRLYPDGLLLGVKTAFQNVEIF